MSTPFLCLVMFLLKFPSFLSSAGNPPPRRLWYKGSQALMSSPKYVVGVGGRDLTLVGVEPRDAGLYVCVAVNPAGEAQLTTALHVISEGFSLCKDSGSSLCCPNPRCKSWRVYLFLLFPPQLRIIPTHPFAVQIHYASVEECIHSLSFFLPSNCSRWSLCCPDF